MNTQLLLSKIKEVVSLNAEEQKLLESSLISRPVKQGEVLIESGDAARYMLFVNSGYLMTYYTGKEGNDYVIRLVSAGWWCSDMYSLHSDPRTIFTTKALSDGEVLLLPRAAHLQLLESSIQFEKYFRITFHSGLIKQQLRYIEGYSMSAEERYRAFIAMYPAIEQHVAQKYIASYLGISPEFLSKIRNKKK